MAVLVLNAGTASPVSLTVTRAGRVAPITIGSKSQSFAGAERSSIRGIRRQFQVVTSLVTDTVRASIEDVLSHGAQIPCSGDVFSNIQTQCSVEISGVNGVAGLTLWEISLALSEVQPNTVLLKYNAGDTITGESFTRSTTAYYLTGPNTVAQAAINVKRSAHSVAGVGLTLLLEDARTNAMLWSSDFSNAAWTKATTTITTGIADPSGGTTACTLTATAGNATTTQNLAAGASIVRTNTIWLRRRTGTGVVGVLNPQAGAYITQTLTSSWQRFTVVGSASTARFAGIQIATNGDAIDAWQAQQEDASFASSEIPTTTVAVTRGADSYSLPFTTPPQEMTVYAKFVERGTVLVVSLVFDICDAPQNTPIFRVLSTGGTVYESQHNQGGALAVTSVLGAGPAQGDTVELVTRLFGDGSTDITQSLNSAASTAGAQTAVLAPPTAWSGPLVWLNSAGTAGAIGNTALQSFKILSGARSLSECRNA